MLESFRHCDSPFQILRSFSDNVTEYQRAILNAATHAVDYPQTIIISNDDEYNSAMAAFLVWLAITHCSTIVIVNKLQEHEALRATILRMVIQNNIPLTRSNQKEIGFNTSKILFKSTSACMLRGISASLIVLHNIYDTKIRQHAYLSTRAHGEHGVIINSFKELL
jgi:hypothetical protein